jgi:low affinity Fe/Cu permease
MKFTPDEIEGPYLVRVLSTIMFIFIVSALSWLLIWVMGNVAGWSVFIRLLSIAMSTFVIAMFGVAIFNPMSLLNENDLQNKIKIRLEELHQSRQQDINREILGEESEPELDNKVASEVPVEKEDSLPEGETAVESSDGNDSEIPPIFPDNNSEDEKPV